MRPLGVKIPIRHGDNGYFEQTFTTLEVAKTNMFNLILTNKGERPMLPDFGTRIYSLLFENVDTEIVDIVEEEIREAVNTWLPYVNITELFVDDSNENLSRNRLEVTITFGVQQVPDRFETIKVQFNV